VCSDVVQLPGVARGLAVPDRATGEVGQDMQGPIYGMKKRIGKPSHASTRITGMSAAQVYIYGSANAVGSALRRAHVCAPAVGRGRAGVPVDAVHPRAAHAARAAGVDAARGVASAPLALRSVWWRPAATATEAVVAAALPLDLVH
jgi:hypothetical protein